MATLNFDASNVKPQLEFEPVPPCIYNMRIVDSKVKPTKDNAGTVLELQCEIIDGEFAGRRVFDRMNLANKNEKAVGIGQARLSAYCHATGVIVVADSSQLHGIPFKAKVGVREAEGTFSAQNEIKAVKHINDSFDSKAAVSSAAPQASAPAWAAKPAPSASPPAAAPVQAAPPAPAAPPPAWAQPPVAPPAAAPVQAAPPPPPAPPAPVQAPPAYKLGDIVNGHQLTATGWIPIQAAPPPAKAPWE